MFKLSASETIFLVSIIILLLIVPTLANAGGVDGMAFGLVDALVKAVLDLIANLSH